MKPSWTSPPRTRAWPLEPPPSRARRAARRAAAFVALCFVLAVLAWLTGVPA